MFNIGDKVVYPMHGAGIIEAIEEKEVLGEKRQYYIMRLPLGDMKVMIPLGNITDLGIRQVIDEDGVQKVMTILHDKQTTVNASWNRRYRAHMEKIKSGDIFEVAEVVRNLVLREQEKGLSTGERKMLDTARQILVSELVLAREEEADKVHTMIEGAFA